MGMTQWRHALATIIVVWTLVKLRRRLTGKADDVKLMLLKHPEFERVLQEKERLRKLQAPLYALNGFWQTVLFNYFMPAPELQFERELVPFQDGGQASLDWFRVDKAREQVICVVFPALGTSCRTKYVRHLCEYFARNDISCVVLNVRGSAGTDLTSHKLFDGGRSEDIDHLAWHIQKSNPHAKTVAIGASMGSNILVRYLCDHRVRHPPFAAAVSVSNPFNLHELLQIEQQWPFNLSYFRDLFESRFVTWFKRRLGRFQHLFRDKSSVDYDFDEWLDQETIQDFSDFAARKVFKYSDFEEYLQASSCGNYIESLRIPTCFINSVDDPLVPLSLIPQEKLAGAQHANLILTKRGGHIAFLNSDLTSWFMPLAKAFLQTNLQ